MNKIDVFPTLLTLTGLQEISILRFCFVATDLPTCSYCLSCPASGISLPESESLGHS